MIYHLYKTDCTKASRVLMQSRWDEKFSFIHIPAADYAGPHIRLRWKNFLRTIFSMRQQDCIVFHAQSSLPYLLVAFLMKNIFPLKGNYVYDIHDLHELNSEMNVWSREFLRYIVFLILEFLIFKCRGIRKITVSNGLALVISRKYQCEKPSVVHNISIIEHEINENQMNNRSNSIIYFGTRERAPLEIIHHLLQNGFCIEIFGRDIDERWLTNSIGKYDLNNLKIHGEFSPERLEFLNNYKFSIIFSPTENSLNFKHSLPNKLFQSLAAGHTVLVSENFEEMNDLFSDTPNAVLPVNSNTICNIIRNASKQNEAITSRKLREKIKTIQINSREHYMRATRG